MLKFVKFAFSIYAVHTHACFVQYQASIDVLVSVHLTQRTYDVYLVIVVASAAVIDIFIYVNN